MTKLEQLLKNYRLSCTNTFLLECSYVSYKAELADAEEALKQHIEGAMEAAVVHGRETEREAAKLGDGIHTALDWQESVGNSWEKLIGEWAK